MDVMISDLKECKKQRILHVEVIKWRGEGDLKERRVDLKRSRSRFDDEETQTIPRHKKRQAKRRTKENRYTSGNSETSAKLCCRWCMS